MKPLKGMRVPTIAIFGAAPYGSKFCPVCARSEQAVCLPPGADNASFVFEPGIF